MSYPVALPFAWLKPVTISCKSATNAETVATTALLSCATNMRAPSRAGRRIIKRLKESLSQRDLAVIRSVELYRYLTARHIEDLHFYDHRSPLTGARTCRRVLERLTATGVLVRLERRVGGIRAGSASYIYGLGSVGQRVLHQGDEARIRRREPSLTFLDHTLAISQLAADLTVISRLDLVDLLELTPEPGCWRSFQRGMEGTVTLRPDLAVAVRAAGYHYQWFVEVDLGTHSSTSVVRKCRVYQDYWRSGIEQDAHGLFPKVLWVTPTARRAEQLRRAISAAHGLYENLFDVTTTDEAVCRMVGVKS